MPGLESRLLEAAARIVDDEGLSALTLRALATRVGVSRQAPYLHFKSKDQLLAALAAEGLRREGAWAETGLDHAGTPEARAFALTRAHLALRKRHPGLYALAHGAVSKSASDELQAEAARSFARLKKVVCDLSHPETPLGTIRIRCMILFGFVRGMAEVSTMASVPVSVPGDVGAWTERGLVDLVASWSRRASSADSADPAQ